MVRGFKGKLLSVFTVNLLLVTHQVGEKNKKGNFGKKSSNQLALKLIMDSESSSGGVSDAELFDMLFGMAPKNNSSNHSNSNNNLRHQLMTETEAPLSPCYNSSISEPGYGLIERCWEPGEIVDQDFEISTSLSSSSSPVRSYQDRYRRNKVRK